MELVLKQDYNNAECPEIQRRIKATTTSEKRTKAKQSAANIHEQFPVPLQRGVELAQEKVASTWLTTLPIDNHGFSLHKTAFRDALSLRYGWMIKKLTITLLLWSHIQRSTCPIMPNWRLPLNQAQ